MLPILEDVALAKVTMWVDKNPDDLTVNCLLRQPSNIFSSSKWPGNGVPAPRLVLEPGGDGHVRIWIQIRESIPSKKTVPHRAACLS